MTMCELLDDTQHSFNASLQKSNDALCLTFLDTGEYGGSISPEISPSCGLERNLNDQHLGENNPNDCLFNSLKCFLEDIIQYSILM